MTSITGVLLAILGVILTLGFIFLKYKLSYWSRRGVKSITPSLPFGNFGPLFLQKCSIGELCAELYNRTTEPFIGVYITVRSAILIRDPELVRHILIKDFQHFHDRGFYVNEDYDPLSGHLLSLSGDKWKYLRAKLTPTFTSGKLKTMFQTLVDTGYTLQKYLKNKADINETIEVRDILACYTTDIIASVAFGIENDSINESDNMFRKMGKEFFAPNFKNGVRIALNALLPKLTEFLKIKSVDNNIETFMISMVKQTLEYREKNNVFRKDFMQLLIQLRNSGKVLEDDKWDVNIADESKKQLTINEVAAQAFIFFLAGFETSSTTMSFCLYELSKNKAITAKLQKEIDDILKKNNNQIDYDSLSEMKYLESCIDETLRKYPPLPFLSRECTIPYKMPGTDIVLEKGTPIIIPILALQRDPKYYPNPMLFDPDRFFIQKNVDKSPPYAPFGEGPRACIGTRMGKMLSKVGLVMMLSTFSYELGEGMLDVLKIDPRSALLTPMGGLNLKISNRIKIDLKSK